MLDEDDGLGPPGFADVLGEEAAPVTAAPAAEPQSEQDLELAIPDERDQSNDVVPRRPSRLVRAQSVVHATPWSAHIFLAPQQSSMYLVRLLQTKLLVSIE